MGECSTPMKLNVKVEAEELSKDTGLKLTEEVDLDNEIMMILKTEPVVKVQNNDEENSSNTITAGSNDDNKSGVSISLINEDSNNSNSILRGLLNKNDSSNFSVRSIHQCKITDDMFFKELNELSKIHSSLSMGDRILLVESRNIWGRSSIATHYPSRDEVEIQSILNEWKYWMMTSRYSDTPLMYKCYLCKAAWWRLHEFREHLNEIHCTEQFYCYFEKMLHEFNIIAGLETKPAFDNFSIDADCLKCGHNYEFHTQNHNFSGKESSFLYICNYCNLNFYTCTNYVTHQSSCLGYKKFTRKRRRDKGLLKFYSCLVCKLKLVSRENLHRHYISVHSVSSDLPIMSSVKECAICKVNFIDIKFHKCLRKSFSTMCSGCCQTFSNKVARDTHVANHNKKFICRICNVVLDSDCMEPLHIVRNHSTHFRIIYKCLLCETNIFLLNELSTKRHIINGHKMKFNSKRIYFELVVVPSKCVTPELVEQMDIVTSQSEQMRIIKQRSIIEPSIVKEINIKNNMEPTNKPIDDFFTIIEHESILDAATNDNNNTSCAFENVVLSVNYEKQSESNNPKYENLPEKVAETENSNAKENNNINKQINVKVEKDDDLQETDNEVNMITNKVIEQVSDFKQENYDDNYEMLLSKVFGNSSTTNMVPAMVVKQEIKDEEFFEDDTVGLSLNVVNEIAMESQVEAPPAKKQEKRVLDIPKLQQPKKVKLSEPVKSTSKTMSTECERESSHFECIKHLSQSKAFLCTKCHVKFVSIEGYTNHFQEHGLDANFCPVCKEEAVKSFPLHLQKHMSSSFSKVQLLDDTDDIANIDLMYYCNECQKPVERVHLFKHWEGHLILDKSKTTTFLKPVILQEIESILLGKITNVKQDCIICKRNLYRRYDIRRHMIEHLISDAVIRCKEMGALKCQFCYDNLANVPEFRYHMRNHASLPVYQCEVCCKKFTDYRITKHKKNGKCQLESASINKTIVIDKSRHSS